MELGHTAPVAAVEWERERMRRALAERDFRRVFQLLASVGVSQRRIGRLTGLSSSDLYEILHRDRVLSDINVLLRVVDGLGIPRGYAGLAYSDSTRTLLDMAAASCTAKPSEQDEVRDLLAYASTVATGTASDDLAQWWEPITQSTSPPSTVYLTDVSGVQGFTAAMRKLDYRFGGGSVRDAVIAHVRYAEGLLTADYTDGVGPQLHSAVADLHNLAGWTSFDIGNFRQARRHFRRALKLGLQAQDSSLLSNILYRAGRLHLHRGMPDIALKYFQLGQLTAQDSGCGLTVAMLHVNAAWAQAILGNRAHMLQSIGRAEDEFARANSASANPWVRFFGEADLHASTGVALASNAAATSADLAASIEHISAAVQLRGPDMTRSQAFERTALATAYLRHGDIDMGIQIGMKVLESAAEIRSVRVIDRLAPLRRAASTRTTGDQRELVQMIDALGPANPTEIEP
ncbi:tetratricopeptide repeat protein [Nocardia stercoris]|uniref:hypothetical protein n=1 Tax=Nocardia stercoris TaxID=2483361 RepID=UPI0018F3561F|nr:hypothetical protein [Nocardia stercoris]